MIEQVVGPASNKLRRISFSALPYVVVVVAAAIFLMLAKWEKDAAYDEALRNYRSDASLQSRRAASQIEAKFRQIYQGIRTLARLPGVRSIDRYAQSFDENARSSAQEIYNNLAESVAVSEVYIVPVDFDPDAVDPNTGKLQEPITTFDELIVGRTAESSKSLQLTKINARPRKVDEIEIHEYRLMKEQLAVLKTRFPDERQIDRLSYPAIAGREVITCDNTRFSPSKPDDRDRMGLVYSVPFYDGGGALRGIVSAVILTSAVADMLPAESFVLHNPKYDYVAGNMTHWGDDASGDPARSPSDLKSNLLYSETIELDITDLTGGWMLWTGLHDRNYWSSAGAISASAKAATQQIIIVVSAIFLCFVIYAATAKYRAAHSRRLELEASIAERTRDLAAATEAANSANRAKSRFLSIMSHEMRTPMTAIIGMSDLLSHSKLKQHENRYVRVIQSSAGALLSLINDILDLSKIEAGKIELHPSQCAIDQIVSDVVGTFAEQLQKKDVVLISEVDQNLPAAIYADGVRLRQVLVNLVGNAVKFTGSGQIRVSVKPGMTHPDGRLQLLFSVSDTGAGIAPEAGDSIFEPFRQDHDGAASNVAGTGLGLSISRTLVEMMGGAIRYESALGEGTTFYFDICVEPRVHETTDDVAPETSRGGDVVVENGFDGASILLAEDNPVSQEVIRVYLELLGVDVAIAEDGRRAVELAGLRQFDAILMDCQMPEIDGFEATRLIRQQAKEARQKAAPIIALTANAFVEDRARCMKAGMTDYLSKPFTATSLLKVLSKHLRQTGEDVRRENSGAAG